MPIPVLKHAFKFIKKCWFLFYFLGKLKLWVATANHPKASCLFRASDNLSENFRKNPRNVLRIQNKAGTDYGALTKSKQYFKKLMKPTLDLPNFKFRVISSVNFRKKWIYHYFPLKQFLKFVCRRKSAFICVISRNKKTFQSLFLSYLNFANA